MLRGTVILFIMDLDGSNKTRLTDSIARDGAPRWSPDGTKIVFDSNREDGTGQIYVMNVDGSEQKRLTHNPAGDDGYPSWSADGANIIY